MCLERIYFQKSQLSRFKKWIWGCFRDFSKIKKKSFIAFVINNNFLGKSRKLENLGLIQRFKNNMFARQTLLNSLQLMFCWKSKVSCLPKYIWAWFCHFSEKKTISNNFFKTAIFLENVEKVKIWKKWKLYLNQWTPK